MESKKTFFNFLENQKIGIIFLSFLVIRLLFIFLLKAYWPSAEILPDSERYDILSTQITQGNFNLDCGLFLVAPFYPYFLACIKLIFGEHWHWIVPIIQIGISCLSGVYFYRLTKVIFESERVAFFAILGYCIYPFTMWFVHVISQETFYQTFLIFSLYHFVFGLKYNKKKHLIYSAILFSICFLTKSIILFFSPFLALLIYWYFNGNIKRKLKMVFLYSFICLVFTIPNGVYNWKTHGVYTISSDGLGFFFSLSNNDNIAQSIGLYHFEKEINKIDYNYGRPFELDKVEGEKIYLPAERNKLYLKEGWQWVKENPKKWFRLSFTKLQQFLMPGFGIAYHPFKKWLLSFLISFPVFIFGYYGILKGARLDFKIHGWMFFLFFSMMIFSIIFSNQGRFRIVTLEGFYLMYAAYGWVNFLDWIKKKGKNF